MGYDEGTTCYIPIKTDWTAGESIAITNIYYRHVLNLAGECNWKSFPNVILKSYPSIDELHIFCPIESLSSTDFEGAGQLKHLELYSRKLGVIHEDTFRHLNKLSYLDLSFNFIQDLEEYAFRGMVELKHLDLIGNRLKILRKNTFSGLTNLENVNFKWNKLTSIEEGTFDLTQVNEIHLENNLLATLPSELFVNAPMLRILDISFNNFTKIPDAIFKPQLTADKIVFDYNVLNESKLTDLLNISSAVDVSLVNVRLKLPEENGNETIVDGSKLKKIHLSGNRVTDNILEHLKIFPNLEVITLRPYGVRRISGIENIKSNFPNLNEIKLLYPFDCEWVDSVSPKLKELGIRTIKDPCLR